MKQKPDNNYSEYAITDKPNIKGNVEIASLTEEESHYSFQILPF